MYAVEERRGESKLKGKIQGPDLDRYIQGREHHYISYFQGAKEFGMPYWSFVKFAKEAGAAWALRKTAIVDVEILERYMEENCHLEEVRKKEESEREHMRKRREVENIEELVLSKKKKYVRYEEGAALYSLGLHTFQQLARDAKACYKIRNIVLVDTEKFEAFIKTFLMDEED